MHECMVCFFSVCSDQCLDYCGKIVCVEFETNKRLNIFRVIRPNPFQWIWRWSSIIWCRKSFDIIPNSLCYLNIAILGRDYLSNHVRLDIGTPHVEDVEDQDWFQSVEWTTNEVELEKRIDFVDERFRMLPTDDVQIVFRALSFSIILIKSLTGIFAIIIFVHIIDRQLVSSNYKFRYFTCTNRRILKKRIFSLFDSQTFVVD